MFKGGGARWDVGWVWKVHGSLSLVLVYIEVYDDGMRALGMRSLMLMWDVQDGRQTLMFGYLRIYISKRESYSKQAIYSVYITPCSLRE